MYDVKAVMKRYNKNSEVNLINENDVTMRTQGSEVQVYMFDFEIVEEQKVA